MSNSFSVRVARPSDYQALSLLLAELLGQKSVADDLVQALNTNLLRLLSTPGTTLLVAEEESEAKVIGFISVFSYWGLLDDAPNALLDRVVVASKYQGSSVVAALIEQGIGACQAMGCSKIDFSPAEGSLIPTDILEQMGFSKNAGRFELVIK